MKLPFLWIALGFSLGIVTEKYWNISAIWLVCGLFVGIILLWFLRGRRYFLVLFVLLLGCSGILWARMDAYVPANAVQNFASPRLVTLRGVVNSLPEIKTRGKRKTVSFVLTARSITKENNGRRKFFKVSGNVQTCLLQSPLVPQVGDTLRIFGELSIPKQVMNPGEFDYGSFLAQKNIHAVFQTIGEKSVRVIHVGSRFLPARILAETRRSLAALIDKLYVASEAAILKALVLGLRSNVSSEVRDQFMKTGTIHQITMASTKWDYDPFSNAIAATPSSQTIWWARG
ncbi:MAG: ComEC/Rec2 family competence protein [Candidatus Omnitrophota bacterium]